jgi:hypothetical protein
MINLFACHDPLIVQVIPPALEAMAAAFQEKVAKGEAKKHSSGYHGTGYKHDITEAVEALKVPNQGTCGFLVTISHCCSCRSSCITKPSTVPCAAWLQLWVVRAEQETDAERLGNVRWC